MSGGTDLADADAKLIGEEAGDLAGNSVSTAGDVNEDGFADLLVGAPEQNAGGSSAGAAYVVLGPVSGGTDLADADAKLIGEEAGDDAGYSVSTAGDVNTDGIADLLVGGFGQDSGGNEAGAAYVILGPVSGEFDLADADAKRIGEEASDDAGWSVSTAGDVNADGFADLLIGAPNQGAGGSHAGSAYVVLGPVSGEADLTDADAKLVGEESVDALGYSVSTAGDVNADDLADLLLGVPIFQIGAAYQDDGGSNAGAAYLLLSPSY